MPQRNATRRATTPHNTTRQSPTPNQPQRNTKNRTPRNTQPSTSTQRNTAQHSNTTMDVTRGTNQVPAQNTTHHDALHPNTTPHNVNTTTNHNLTKPHTITVTRPYTTQHAATHHTTQRLHNITCRKAAPDKNRRYTTTSHNTKHHNPTKTTQHHATQRNTTPHNQTPKTTRDATWHNMTPPNATRRDTPHAATRRNHATSQDKKPSNAAQHDDAATCHQPRRRRRCGPPVGRPRGTSPWCPPALHGLESDWEGGFTPTRPAKNQGGGSPLPLLSLSPGPRYVHAPALHVAGSPPRGTESGARQSADSTSGTVHQPPKGRGTQSDGCGPLAARYYRLGGVWPAEHEGLVRCPVPPPPPAHGTSAEGVRAQGHPLTLRLCPPNPQCRTSTEGTSKPPPR